MEQLVGCQSETKRTMRPKGFKIVTLSQRQLEDQRDLGSFVEREGLSTPPFPQRNLKRPSYWSQESDPDQTDSFRSY